MQRNIWYSDDILVIAPNEYALNTAITELIKMVKNESLILSQQKLTLLPTTDNRDRTLQGNYEGGQDGPQDDIDRRRIMDVYTHHKDGDSTH